MNPNKRIESWLKKESKVLAEKAIWQDDLGKFRLFGQYTISANANACQVECQNAKMEIFSNKRIAASWCVAQQYRRYDLARQIKNLDEHLRTIEDDINVRASLARQGQSLKFQEDTLTKLELKFNKKKMLESWLDKYIIWAKYTQQRGFQNETATASQTTKSQTNR